MTVPPEFRDCVPTFTSMLLALPLVQWAAVSTRCAAMSVPPHMNPKLGPCFL